MRIAIFHELPEKSGSRKAVNEIAKRLKKNHDVDLFFIDEKKNPNEYSFFSEVFFYSFHPVLWHGKNWRARLYRDTLELRKLYTLHKKIAKVIMERKYDVIFIHGSRFTESPFILRFLPKNTIYYAHAPNYAINVEKRIAFENIGNLKRLYELLNRKMRKTLDKGNIKKISHILANSTYTQKQIKKIYKRESSVCYLGVDEKIYKPKRGKKDFDILYIGSKEFMDGYDLLEQALTLMKKKPKVRSLFFEKEWIANDAALAKIYNKSKMTVCLAYDEPFGLTAIESQSCGVPVVAVNEAGYRESVINEKTGFLVNRNSNLLAKKVTQLLENSELQKKLSYNARKLIEENFTWAKSVNKMEYLFRKIAKI